MTTRVQRRKPAMRSSDGGTSRGHEMPFPERQMILTYNRLQVQPYMATRTLDSILLCGVFTTQSL